MSLGRHYVDFVQRKSSHKKDIISVDMSDDHALATASIDNIICFWNVYNVTESKAFHIPKQYAAIEKNQHVQCIRFLKNNDANYLLIFLNSGNIYILDCLRQQLVPSLDSDGPLIEKTAEYASIDTLEDMIVSVSEYGYGIMHKIITITNSNNQDEKKFKIELIH